jgi:hypothetical protein
MARGKLLAVGTNEYIKKQFGIGYNLKVSLDNKAGLSEDLFVTQIMPAVKRIMEQRVPEARLNP